MKISSVKIRNFKSIRELDVDFIDAVTGQIRPITAFFGDNGSGKTSVLQAIALTLSMATRKTNSPADFQWHGFLADRLNSLGETRIELDVILEKDEINAVHDIYTLWKGFLPPSFEKKSLTAPKRESTIKLIYENGKISASGGMGSAVELLGRYYTKYIMSHDKKHRQFFERVGDVFWFDQYRNLGSGVVLTSEDESSATQLSWQAGVEGLRKFLVGWWHHHQYSAGKSSEDFIKKLEDRFSRIFIDASFDGLEPMPSDDINISPPDFYFIVKRNNTRYDISEMSSGEQAVFCVLYEFVRLRIAHSIVLIDELELHLHPPQQQSLYNSLRKLGPDCQYIITSHSPYLDDVIPDEYKVRLQGGRLCL